METRVADDVDELVLLVFELDLLVDTVVAENIEVDDDGEVLVADDKVRLVTVLLEHDVVEERLVELEVVVEELVDGDLLVELDLLLEDVVEVLVDELRVVVDDDDVLVVPGSDVEEDVDVLVVAEEDVDVLVDVEEDIDVLVEDVDVLLCGCCQRSCWAGKALCAAAAQSRC